MYDKLLSEADAAEFLGVSRGWLRQARCQGPREGRAQAPAYIKSGRVVRYTREDLATWIQTHRVDPAGVRE